MQNREHYFSPDKIRQQATEMLNDFRHPGRQFRHPFQFQHSALLVLDMQRYFLESSSHAYIPCSGAILPGISSLTKAFLAGGRPVIFSRHINDEMNAGMMSKWWSDVITKADALSELTDALKTLGGKVLEKSQYDAFYNTDLKSQLRKADVTQVIVCGVMTHLCCETTARSAFVNGFGIYFPVDGSATYHEGFHRASLLNLSHGFAEMTTMQEMLSLVQGHHAG